MGERVETSTHLTGAAIMSTSVKTSAHHTGADISKRIQAKLNVKKKILAFMGTPVKTFAHHTRADISKRIQAKLNVKKKDIKDKREKKYWPAWVPPYNPPFTIPWPTFQRGYKQG